MINGTLYWSWGDTGCETAVLFLPEYRKSTFGYRAKKAELEFISCLWRSNLFFALFFLFFWNPKQALKLVAPTSRAVPGSSRASTGQWSEKDNVLVVQSCLWSPAGVGLVTGTVGWEGVQLICLWSIPNLANSSAAACHLGGTEMFLQ